MVYNNSVVSKLRLNNFRNFKAKHLEFSPKTTVIVGPNTSGKTNIFEAIFLLATGKSFKAQIEEEMISYGQEIARVSGDFFKPKQKLEVVLTRGEITVGQDPEKTERVPRKRLMLNGIAKRLIDFAGNFKAVLFGPWDLELVTESPSVRRKFLDTVLSQVDREYRRASLSYEKGLRQRNRILWKLREESPPGQRPIRAGGQLLFWDRLLIKNGDYISQKREEFINFANDTGKLNDQDFSLDYDKSAISETRLEQYAEEEVAAATTLVGPHRDDMIFKIQNPNSKIQKRRELARYGSRGEQRMGVLWLKLNELAYVERKTEERPTLLLDDIFSELDHEHREVVMGTIGSQQTIITTADPHYVEGLKKVEKIELKG